MQNLEAWRDFVNAESSASILAQDELEEWYVAADKRDPEAFRDALISKYTDIAYKYGLMAAKAAAEYYKAERDETLGGDYSPILADPVITKQLEANVRYAMGHFAFGKGEDEAKHSVYPSLFEGDVRQIG